MVPPLTNNAMSAKNTDTVFLVNVSFMGVALVAPC